MIPLSKWGHSKEQVVKWQKNENVKSVAEQDMMQETAQ